MRCNFLKLLMTKVFLILTGGQTCLSCGCISLDPLCPECQEKKLFRWTSKEERCSCCGKELVSEIDICTSCRNEPLLTHTQQVLPIHCYRLWKKDLLFSWKTAGMRQLSPLLATLMADFIKNELVDLKDCPLVPVPPRKGKIRRQGWDQVDELCRYLNKNHGFKILPLLERKSMEQQKKLDRKSRLENLGQTYCIDTKKLSKIQVPAKVILIDDILTTGVTMETCAAALKSVGVQEVYGCTLFYV